MTPTIQELERAAYCAPSVDTFRAYAAALEQELEDMGNHRTEAESLAERLATAEEHLNSMEEENAGTVAELEATISRLEYALQDAGATGGTVETIEATPAQAPAICSAGLPTVATHAMPGEIIELRTVDGDAVRVARAHFESPRRTIMATFTRAGKIKGGRGIHRGNLLTDGADLTTAAQLESALKAYGWSVVRYPRSAEQRAKLAGMGFEAIIQTAPGQFEPHPLGLAWAKPGAVAASGEQTAQLSPAGAALPTVERATIKALGDFVGRSQLAAILDAMRGEEGEYFGGLVGDLARRIDAMPQTYQQDGIGDAAIVSLHYFNAGSDWYITEKDADGGTSQAFGYAVLNGMEDNAELGYISVTELVAHGVELDLYWQPRTLGEVKAERTGDDGGPDGAGSIPTSGEQTTADHDAHVMQLIASRCQTLLPGRWIPGGAENAERIAFDAALGAEVWLIASTARAGSLAVIAYAGKRTKHDAHYTMCDRGQALQWAGEYMGKQQASAQRQAERRAEKAAKRAAGHKLQVGDVLRSSWGYDQTNIDYYEVTRLIGTRMVEIREIGAESVESGSMAMQGDCVPRPGHYIGAPMRKAVSDYDGQSVRIASYASAHKIEPREVAGVKLFPVDHWTAYA